MPWPCWPGPTAPSIRPRPPVGTRSSSTVAPDRRAEGPASSSGVDEIAEAGFAHVLHEVRGEAWGEQPALHHVAAEAEQLPRLIGGLDPLGDDAETHRAGERHDGVHDRSRRRV